jgi:lipopolysaccharide transport system permease protein
MTDTVAPPLPLAARDDRPLTVIRATQGPLDIDLRSLGSYGELLYFLVWRDIKLRYKQTLVGAGWALVQPLMTMAIFTVVFSGLAKVPSDGVPYPLFAFTALIAWTYFAAALARSSGSLVGNANLITKVYFPRVIIPLSGVLSPLLDLLVALGLLVVLLAWFQVSPGVGLLALPVFVLLGVLTAFAVSLWLSALSVRYRDVGVVVPFLLQLWMFASPVAYPSSMVPAQWRLLYGFNPMSGVIDGFRWAILGTSPPDLRMLGVTAFVTVLVLAGGLVYFNRMEQEFADVV